MTTPTESNATNLRFIVQSLASTPAEVSKLRDFHRDLETANVSYSAQFDAWLAVASYMRAGTWSNADAPVILRLLLDTAIVA